MQRFKRFLDAEIVSQNLRNTEKLISYGIDFKTFPSSLDEFDEIEFSLTSGEEGIVLCVAVLEGKIKRIMFVSVDKENTDEYRPLTQEQLSKLLDEYGERLVKFFEFVTQ